MAGLFLAWTLQGAEPTLEAGALPRVPATPPWNVLDTFEVKPGFKLELAAAEPMVMDPVALCFDEDGRLFVVEMRGYSERRPERLGRVRMLEDRDGDGRFDRSTVYVDRLMWPTAVICYNGGIFVGETPNILFCRDADGDGVADERRAVFTGFASEYAPYETNRLNVQAMLNSFRWGLDNRIHGATSTAGGLVKRAAMPDDPGLLLRGRDFSFDPETMEMRAENGGGQHGMSFDSGGRKFVCSNSSHCRTVMHDYHYSGRNPHYALPGGSVNIAVDGDAAEVHRISPDEAWRVVRTRWRVEGLVQGPVEGGGRPSGYFTGATGITVFRGDAWPPGFQGDIFIADCGSNLIHRKQVRSEGMSLKAVRPEGEEKQEFLASQDNWFRPVQFANAPDGTFYIADMYREVIEHPWSLPANIKRHLDLNNGNDRGRIYRIVPEGHIQRQGPRLGKASSEELIDALDHPNGWHRDTASRLLVGRRNTNSTERLASLVRTGSPHGRLHSLYVLSSLGVLRSEDLLAGLRDDDPMVRRHALKLLEGFHPRLEAVERAASWQILGHLVNDPAVEVRHQLALTLGMIDHESRVEILEDLMAKDAADPWMKMALLNSVREDGAEMLVHLLERGAELPVTALQELARMAGAEGRDVPRVLESAGRVDSLPRVRAVIMGLGEGLKGSGGSLAEVSAAKEFSPLFEASREVALSDRASSVERVDAIRFLALSSQGASGRTLESLLSARHPISVQTAALEALFALGDGGVENRVLTMWGELTPRLRAQAVSRLISGSSGAAALMGAIGSGEVRASELSSTQTSFLREHRDDAISRQALLLFGEKQPGDKRELIESFRPALGLAGDLEGGRGIFIERCASCHRLGAEGHALGPDLATVRAGGREMVLMSLLDPNREVGPGYLSYEVERVDGETLLGIVSDETALSLVVRQPGGLETTVFRKDVVRLRSQRLSMMSEGLEAGLSHQQMADLLEFIMNAPAGR